MLMELDPSTRRTLRKALRNRNIRVGGAIVAAFVLMGLLAPFIAPYDPTKGNLRESLLPPCSKYPFGTDFAGRDVLSRVIWGARTSLIVSTVSVFIAVIAGVLVGGLSAYVGGWIDEVVTRIVDVMLSFPDILLALFVAAIVGPGLENVIVAVALYNFPQFVRIMRGSALQVKEMEYVEAARAIGESNASIFARYLLPNSLAPIVVHATLRTAASILTAAGLSFLGLGVQPPIPEWGQMMSDARTYLVTAPHVWIFPGVALFITVLGFNLLGDGLNDVLNPKMEV